MKKIIFVLCSIALLFSCKQPVETSAPEVTDERVELAEPIINADSIKKIMVDSLFALPVKISSLFTPVHYDNDVIKYFTQLAKATNGQTYFAASAKAVSKKVDEVIAKQTENNTDVMFLIDKTGSMEDDLAELKRGMTQVIDELKTHTNVRVAFAFYGDKNVDGSNWFSYKNCESNFDDAIKVINGISTVGGGDTPESVYDGFFQTQKLNFWKSENKRMIVLIGDAPPLEDNLTTYHLQDVITESTKQKVVMNFYPVIVSPDADDSRRPYTKKNLIVSVSPNPSSGEINVTFSDDDEKQLEILSNTGKLLSKEKITGSSFTKDISSLPTSLLIVRASNNKNQYDTEKLVLVK